MARKSFMMRLKKIFKPKTQKERKTEFYREISDTKGKIIEEAEMLSLQRQKREQEVALHRLKVEEAQLKAQEPSFGKFVVSTIKKGFEARKAYLASPEYQEKKRLHELKVTQERAERKAKSEADEKDWREFQRDPAKSMGFK